ncbi:class I SAM-dependent methyltransferase [Candidatus Latescibacterota bacterium]
MDELKKQCSLCGSEKTVECIHDRFSPDNRYYRCSICGSRFSSLMTSDPNESARFHSEVYYTPENEGPGVVPEAEAYFVARLIELVPDGRLLDVGCGRGHWMHYIRELSSLDVEGVELSEDAASYAREQHGLTVVTGDLVSARFKDDSFEAVYLRHVLEHVTEPAAFIAEVFRILIPGGICAVHVPNDESLTNKLKRFLYRVGYGIEYGSLFYPLHVNAFTPSSLDRFFNKAGFVERSSITISKAQSIYEFPRVRQDMLLYPIAMLERILGCGNLMVGWFEKR